MTVQTSYPGVYIQELPSLAHTITPAPTSVAVFVGYTHPFLTLQPGTPIQLFSFAGYQANFGGFFASPWQPDYVGQAVFQFFQNGGQTCFVVGLQAEFYYLSPGGQPATAGTSSADVPVAAANLLIGTPADGITFTATQPVGYTTAATSTAPAVTAGIAMFVTLSNITSSTPAGPNDTADIVISYGNVVETYRKVLVTDLPTSTMAAGPTAQALAASNLVTVVRDGAPEFPAPTAPGVSVTSQIDYAGSSPSLTSPDPTWSVIHFADFGPVFETGNPLDKVPVFNLLVTPGITDPGVTSDAVAYCERKRAFFIMDTPSPQDGTAWQVNNVVQNIASMTPQVSINAAVYYPWLVTTDPVTGLPSTAPPSGFVAGIYGQEDSARGVWKSPAGIETALLGTTGVVPDGVMTDSQQGILNQNAIDCLRQFAGIGTVVFGARTTAGADANTAYQQWKYVAVRRTALFLEQSLYASLTWAVFEPNAAPLWTALSQDVTAFMLSLFRQGAFAGTTPSEAFVVQCDATTTTPTDVANGTVNILVGFAPLVPAEFVVVQIAQLAGQAQN